MSDKIIKFPIKTEQEKRVEEAEKRDAGFKAAANIVRAIKKRTLPKKEAIELVIFLVSHFNIKREETEPDCILRMEMTGFKLKTVTPLKSVITEQIKNQSLNGSLGYGLAVRIVKLAKYCYNIT